MHRTPKKRASRLLAPNAAAFEPVARHVAWVDALANCTTKGRLRLDGASAQRALADLFALRSEPAGGRSRGIRLVSYDDAASKPGSPASLPPAVVVVMEDDGPGVPPSVLPRLFGKFSSGHDAAAGTGFGLFFCRITVENWGGGIGYEPRSTSSGSGIPTSRSSTCTCR
jgi:signal transduction histidine kinase